METEINSNHDLQSLFGETNPDSISEKLLRGLNTIIKETITIKRVQLTSNATPYWNNSLSESLKEVKMRNKEANQN